MQKEKTCCGEVSRTDIVSIKRLIEEEIKKLQKVHEELEFVDRIWAEHGDIAHILLTTVLTDVCIAFNDCVKCPLSSTCPFAIHGCERDELLPCSPQTCPRVRICLSEGDE